MKGLTLLPSESGSRELYQYCVEMLNQHSSQVNQQDLYEQKSSPLSKMIFEAQDQEDVGQEQNQQQFNQRACRKKVKSYIEEQDPLFSPSELRKLKRRKLIRKFNIKNKVDILDCSKQPCNCTKSFCQKMYCECLARGKLCSIQCRCQNCQNKQPNKLLVAVVNKIESNDFNSQGAKRDRFRSGRFKNGCTCKKSQCQKKYCECFVQGRNCGSGCKCTDCENHLTKMTKPTRAHSKENQPSIQSNQQKFVMQTPPMKQSQPSEQVLQSQQLTQDYQFSIKFTVGENYIETLQKIHQINDLFAKM